MFEPRVAQLAGFRATEVDFSALEDALAQLRGSRSERGRFMLQDERFQLRMARATHNEVVMGVFSRLFKDLRIVRDLALRDDTESATEWAIDSLTRLLTAIMSRDPQAIDRQVGEHLDYLEAVWRKRTGRSVARDVPDFLKGRLSGREVDGRDGSHSRYEAVLASGGV
jgi:DNA-binding FadR family transcriptional regulator